jgi:DNA-binding transcriptional regulator YhcF (GntR family)
MSWKFNGSEPIYLQIADEMMMRMIDGTYQTGSKLPSVRDLALEAGVNPNTMQRAMGYLEMKNLVHSERTSGRYVTDDSSLLNDLKEQMIRRYVQACCEQLKRIGVSEEETEEAIRKGMNENGSDQL